MNAQMVIVMDAAWLKRAQRRLFIRKSRLTMVLMVVITLFIIRGLTPALGGGEDDWVLAIPAGVALLVIAVLLLYQYIVYVGIAKAHVRKFGVESVTVEVTDEHLRYASQSGEQRFPWQAFDAVWRWTDQWLLFYNPVNALILPAEQLAPEVREFIVAKVKENGGKVK
jgi:hypothetical protein